MRTAIALFAIGIVLAIQCEAATVSGRIRFVGRAAGVSLPAIVYAEPLDGARVQPGQFKMEQKNKTFVPHVLAVPVGSTVSFPNSDSIFHNVFSLSRPGPFDLGLYRSGDSKDRTFKAPATYRVFCNIHPQMSAIIMVIPTSYVTEVDNAGNYRLDLPAGRYRITAWSERAEPETAELTVGSSPQAVPDLSLDESKFVEVKRTNKFGQDYPKSAYDPKKN
jgi:plastocyanin